MPDRELMAVFIPSTPTVMMWWVVNGYGVVHMHQTCIGKGGQAYHPKFTINDDPSLGPALLVAPQKLSGYDSNFTIIWRPPQFSRILEVGKIDIYITGFDCI